MKKFLKTFGKGILAIVLLPLIVLFFACYLVYCFFLYLYQAIKWIVIFFKGKDYKAPLPEEIEAEEKMTNKVYDPVTKTYKDKSELEPKEKEEKKESTETKQVIYQQNIIMGDNKNIDPNKLMSDFVEGTPEQIEHKEDDVKEISFMEEDNEDEHN